MDTGMLFAACWMKAQMQGASDCPASIEREIASAYRCLARVAGAIAAVGIAILVIDSAADRAATTQGVCHDCIADTPASDGGADLAWADPSRRR